MYGWYFAIIPIVFVVMNTAGFLLMRADKKERRGNKDAFPKRCFSLWRFLWADLEAR